LVAGRRRIAKQEEKYSHQQDESSHHEKSIINTGLIGNKASRGSKPPVPIDRKEGKDRLALTAWKKQKKDNAVSQKHSSIELNLHTTRL